MSLDASLMVINKLRSILLISYPLVLIGLFFISRIFAGRSILPVKHIVSTTNKITRQNLDERVQLPKSQDELYDLSSAINGLMDRIQSAINRERQFTSDASHELRTPLSALRGTLEILIRKPRNHEEYVEKINYGLREIDHMTNTLEKLLILARFDKEPLAANEQEAHIITMIDDIIQRHKKEIVEGNIKIKVTNDSTGNQLVSAYYGGLILENIINNAVKYSPPQSTVSISIDDAENGQRRCTVTDQGEGIAEENLNQIFRPFFRSNMLHNKSTSGSGLGLSIAQKSAEAIGAKIQVDSMLGKGTTFTITF
jgi:signal transduction histidine kinase